MAGKIFVAGHRGLVGSAIVRALEARVQAGEAWEIITRSRVELNLLEGEAVRAFLRTERPEFVIISAARVGGIKANHDYPVEFLLDNLKIQNHLIEGSYETGVRKLLFLGSSCIYPKLAPQPLHEDMLLTGALEPSNEPYAIAKIAGIKLCQAYRRQYHADFISAMPTNLYGPNDNFDLQKSHVLPALIHKFHVAAAERRPAVTLWGTGLPRREFLHVDDLAAACLLLLEKYSSPEIINVGTGQDVTIRELAELVARVVGYPGELLWDASQLDGTPRKLLDVSRMHALGWTAGISLEEGVASTYRWFLEHQHARGLAV